MLKYAWVAENAALEIAAYAGLALTFFNLGDIKNSRYYNFRVQKSKVEPS